MTRSKLPKHDRLRGRHKKRASAEVRDWDRRTSCPPPPPWMDEATAAKLTRLRRDLDPLQ